MAIPFVIKKHFFVKPITKIIAWIISLALVIFVGKEYWANPSTAFFYGKPVPVEFLTDFEQVVVEPDNIDDIQPFIDKGVSLFAYLSIGEINPSRSWFSEIPEHWLLGKNAGWGSRIVDLSNKEWQAHLINKQMMPLWEQGYKGFFLDTLDSYQLISKDTTQWLIQQQALTDLVRTIHDRFPGVKLILNRGFELLPEIAGYAVALAAESLFQRWNATSKSYSEVPPDDHNWLLDRLKQAHDQYGLQIIVIDYVSPTQGELAKDIAKKISALGFTPWVSNPSMDMLGVGK